MTQPRSLSWTLILAASLMHTAAFAQSLFLGLSDGSTSKTVGAGTQFTLVATLSGVCTVAVLSPTQCLRQCQFPQPNIRIDATSPTPSTIDETPIVQLMSDGSCAPNPPLFQTARVDKAQGSGVYTFRSSIDGLSPISNIVTVTVVSFPSATGASVVGTPTAGAVQVRANVVPLNGGPQPTGTVQFTAIVNGQVFSANAPVSGGFATATLPLPASTISTTVTANYLGDSNLNPSSAQVAIQSIGKASSSTATVSTVPQCVPFGGSATLSVTVQGFAPSGRVDFTDNGIAVGSATATNTSNALGSTTFQTTASLSSGAHNLVASYVGDVNNLPSASPTLSSEVPSIFTKKTWDYIAGNVGAGAYYVHYLADLNGDGKADLIQVAAYGPNGGWISFADASGVPGIFTRGTWDAYSPNIGGANSYRHYFADLNGDGKADWIQIAIGGNGGGVSMGTAGAPGIFTNGAWDYYNFNVGDGTSYRHYFADLNGDGKADFIQVAAYGPNGGWISFSGASGVPGIFANGTVDYYSGNIGGANTYNHYFADLNGDGKADWIQILIPGNGGYVSMGTAGAPGIFTSGAWDYYNANVGDATSYRHYFADLNGDGKADWIQILVPGNGGYVSMGTAGAPGILTNGVWDYHSTNVGDATSYRHYFADLNGDGKADWIQVLVSGNGAYVSLGTAGAPGILANGAWDYFSSSVGDNMSYRHYFADVNGDRKADWIQVAAGSSNGGYLSFAAGSLGSCP
jgi:Big-like domain-containing protein